MVLGKSWQFFYFFTLVKIGQEIVFHHILERINGFFKLLNQADNYVEKLGFFNGVISPWVWTKIGNLFIVFF